MWKQCFRGTTQNSSELPVSSFDLEEFCFVLFPLFPLSSWVGGEVSTALLAPVVGADGEPMENRWAPERPFPHSALTFLFLLGDVWLRFHFKPS